MPNHVVRSQRKGSSFVTLRFERGDLIVQFAGPNVGQREAPIIAQEITDALDRAGRKLVRLVFDLTNVRIMSSYGLGTCIDARNRARDVGAQSYVIGLNEQLEELFKMVKVDRLIKIVEDPRTLGLPAA